MENLRTQTQNDSAHKEGKITFREWLELETEREDSRAHILAAAYDARELIHATELTSTVSTDKLVEIIRRNKTGFSEFNAVLEECAMRIEAYMHAEDKG